MFAYRLFLSSMMILLYGVTSVSIIQAQEIPSPSGESQSNKKTVTPSSKTPSKVPSKVPPKASPKVSPTPSATKLKVVSPVQSSSSATQITTTSLQQALPQARRVFVAHLDQDQNHEILLAHQNHLSAWRMQAGQAQKIWQITGPGVVHLVQVADIGKGKELLVAWGMGRGHMQAPIILQAHHMQTGQGREVWRYKGSRNQPITLQLLQQDQDAASEILLGHFISKYHTQAVILDFNATSDIPQVRTLNKIRMGTSWVMGEMDDHKGVDYAIGRVYGDVKGEYGDLIFHGSKQPKTPLVIPSERGVKKVWRLPLKSSQPYLYFSDGWVAAYGKKAKARLKRLFWRDGRPQVELVLNQNKEFTFFDLWVSQEDQKRGPLLWARGNQFISLVEMKKQGMWIAHPLHRLPPVVNVAVGHYEGQWYVCMPQEKKTQIQPLTLPW